MGDIRSGCEAYEKALELEPNMLEAWLNLGQACKEEARVEEAERALTKVSWGVGWGNVCFWGGGGHEWILSVTAGRYSPHWMNWGI